MFIITLVSRKLRLTVETVSGWCLGSTEKEEWSSSLEMFSVVEESEIILRKCTIGKTAHLFTSVDTIMNIGSTWNACHVILDCLYKHRKRYQVCIIRRKPYTLLKKSGKMAGTLICWGDRPAPMPFQNPGLFFFSWRPFAASFATPSMLFHPYLLATNWSWTE